MITAGLTAIGATSCITLYDGAMCAGLGRGRAALLAGAIAVLLGGWFAATGVIAGQGWYRRLPRFPVAAVGHLAVQLFSDPVEAGGHVEAAVIHHTQCGTSLGPISTDRTRRAVYRTADRASLFVPDWGSGPPAAGRPGLLRDLRL